MVATLAPVYGQCQHVRYHPDQTAHPCQVQELLVGTWLHAALLGTAGIFTCAAEASRALLTSRVIQGEQHGQQRRNILVAARGNRRPGSALGPKSAALKSAGGNPAAPTDNTQSQSVSE